MKLNIRNRWRPGEMPENLRWNKFHRDVFGSPAFKKLDRTSKLLLLYLFTQWNGHNNGKLQATLSALKRDFGWGDSPRSLAQALRTLHAAGFIRRTRDWSRSRPALYELTWLTNTKEEQWEISPV